MPTVFYPGSGASQSKAQTSERVSHRELFLLRYLSEAFVMTMKADIVVGGVELRPLVLRSDTLFWALHLW